jgi:hypothetical protein
VVLGGLVSGRGAPPEAEATTANTVPAATPVAATLSARFGSRVWRWRRTTPAVMCGDARRSSVLIERMDGARPMTAEIGLA